jgi:hypothetical protein
MRRIVLIITALCALATAASAQSLPYPYNTLGNDVPPGATMSASAAALQCGATHSPWQAVERCILITMYKDKGMPNLLTPGTTVQAVGLSTRNFNCYAFACNPDNPGNWLLPKTREELIKKFTDNGWKQLKSAPTGPPPHGTQYAAIYENDSGGFEHASVWFDSGVYAKMGSLGIFQFSTFDQIGGGVYGTPTIFFQRAGLLRPLIGQILIQTGTVRHPDGLYATAQQIRILVSPVAPDGQHIGPQQINPPGYFVAAEGIFHNNNFGSNFSFEFENLYDAQGNAHSFNRTIGLRYECSGQSMSC